MKRWLSVSVVVVGTVAGAIAVAVTVAGLLWKVKTARCVARLCERLDVAAPRFSRDELAGLPAPVVRYFEFALTPGQSVVRSARLRQRGEFALRPDAWRPFTAMEYFCVDPPGFLWDARICMGPIISFYVHDGYVAGEGAMYGTLAALVPVLNERGTSVMASGELLRYVAEAAFFPTALLPRNGISWKPLDDDTACVTLTDGATTVSCDVDFSERGEVLRISAMRYRDAHGKPELTPWVGHFSDYRRVEGMMIPMSGNVEWVLPEGPFAYWRGRIVHARYEFAR